MQNVYKIFLVLFVLFIGFNLYSLDWNLGFLHQDNTKFILSIVASLLGLILVFVLNTWSKLPSRK